MACAASGSRPPVTPMPTMMVPKPMDRPMPAPARSTTDTRPRAAVSTSDIATNPSCAKAMGAARRASARSSSSIVPDEPDVGDAAIRAVTGGPNVVSTSHDGELQSRMVVARVLFEDRFVSVTFDEARHLVRYVRTREAY